MNKELKEKLYALMKAEDYMDEDMCADVEEFVELEFDGMFAKEYKGNNYKIRQVWFEYLYEDLAEKYLIQFNLK